MNSASRSDTRRANAYDTKTDDNRRDMNSASFDDVQKYALRLESRVKSFNTDPLHSKAYLTYLVKYLKAPYRKPHKRQQLIPTQQLLQRSFVQSYLLEKGKPPKRTSFEVATLYSATPSLPGDEILFLTGRPSADWLNCIGFKYDLDARFFHQHLGPIIAGQQHWYATPNLPSRSLQVLRLRIPSIIFIGSQGRNLDILSLETARESCNAQLRKAFRSIQENKDSETGKSIVRRSDIHNGSSIVIEQELTVTVLPRGNHWTVLVWNDAGSDGDHGYIPVPTTEDFAPVASQLTFCPVFFESHLNQEQHPSTPEVSCGLPLSKQPLASLNTRYGATIDWTCQDGICPLQAIRELVTFTASAICQYVNLLESTLAQASGPCQFPSYEHTKLETMLHYDHTKVVLNRVVQSIAEIRAFLLDPPANWKPKTTTAAQDSVSELESWSSVCDDFRYLSTRTEKLIKVCEDEKATLLSNASIQEAKRSADEAQLVSKLTKATNRLTFIFLPISFVTSVFGMNFKEFGQGQLHLTLWAIVMIPLLVVSILVVERGQWLKDSFKKVQRRVNAAIS